MDVDGDETRQRILQTVEEYGAIHKSNLQRELGVGWGTLGHHIPILKKERLLDLQTDGGKLWLIRNGLGTVEVELCKAFSTNQSTTIAKAVHQLGEASIQRLSDQLDFSQKVIRTNLLKLEHVAAIESEQTKPRLYRLTNSASRFLLSREKF